MTEIRNAFATRRGNLPFSPRHSEPFDAYTTAQSSFDLGLYAQSFSYSRATFAEVVTRQGVTLPIPIKRVQYPSQQPEYGFVTDCARLR